MASTFGVKIGLGDMDAAGRSLSSAGRFIPSIVAKEVDKVTKQLAQSEAEGAPKNTGTLAQSIGVTKTKIYQSGAIVWAAAGPRHGFARALAIVPSRTGSRIKRMSKKATKDQKQNPPAWNKVEDPAKIAHFAEDGRGALVAGRRDGKPTGKRCLFDSVGGKMYGHSAKASTGSHFMQLTFRSTGTMIEAYLRTDIPKAVATATNQIFTQ